MCIRDRTRAKEKITVEVLITHAGVVYGKDVVGVTMYKEAEETVRQTICIEKARLWSPDDPFLYECVVNVYAGKEKLDEVHEPLGIRKLELDAQHGLRINGEQVKLRGTCIHHDNGIIGEMCIRDREYRLKVTEEAQKIVDQLTLEQKVSLMSGSIVDLNKVTQEQIMEMMGGMLSDDNHYNMTPYPAGGLDCLLYTSRCV